MKLEIWGGAGEHGRSCYVISGDKHRIMFDCGAKKEGQGHYPLIKAEEIPRLTAVFLSHAHEDHSMALPLLYRLGYKGDIWATRATAEQVEIYFASWSKYVAQRGGELPYGQADIALLRFRFIEDEAPPGEWCEPVEGIKLAWGRSGHLAGAVWFRVELEGRRLFFSGDYSRESQLLMADPPDLGQLGNTESYIADLAIVDNAYGLEEEAQPAKLEQLRQTGEAVFKAGGHLMLPLPVFGRSQDLLIWAHEQLPEFTILAENDIWQGLKRMLSQPQWLIPDALERIKRVVEGNRRVKIPEDDQERLQLLQGGTPCLILTGDGTMESSRSRWYYERLSRSSENAIVLTGHASRDSLAKQLLEAKQISPASAVRYIVYKVHQGLADVRYMLDRAPSRRTLLVHAPKAVTDRVVERLLAEGRTGLHSLQPGVELVIY
ncbi:MBL fold metallo-hydrolase [Cohnella terricola]|uniref:MBL fold metallo-hydrolase n=1 Tax=Cohnella terricola TaxID=1289167 RepID=A0A559JTB8_9BACL|nr:MBL fold metallo-hydrolase [Cohnella terricola]TVY03126.1 MBL fold metallo-hydrolase [Cohnella terricola]